MYWRGGPQPTADFNVTLYAGAGLGGGTVDQLDQLPAHPAVGARAVGARARPRGRRRARLRPPPRRGLRAASVNDRCSDLNGPHQRMKEGADALGWSFADDHCATPTPSATTRRRPAYIGFGDQSGAKQSTLQTYLQDAVRRRRRHRRALLRRARARRGRPRGRRRGHLDRSGDRRAPRASPCARRRSWSRPARSSRRRCCCARGIGGPAVGQLPAPAPLHRAVRRLRRGPAGVVGRAAGRPRRRVRRRRGRLRLPDRERAVRDRRWSARRCRSRPRASTRS